MSDISAQIANLSPEERDLLLRKLRQRQSGTEVAERRITSTEGHRRPFDPRRDQNFTLAIGTIGILDSLAYRPTPRIAPGPGQVEIEVYAGSLNFRDLFIALGQYPASAAEMGSDCSGRIARIGEGVKEFEVGDEVIALSDKSSFSKFSTTLVTDVVRKPAYLSFEEAASLPTVFMTTYHSLHNLARLSEGERVLIHSAAGGVGLTAIQYSQWVGAEIFATVGTAEKREYIGSLGVRHILNSRSLEFADEIMKLTNGEGVDVVLNSLMGEAVPLGLSILRPLGRFVELGRRDFAQNSQIGLAPFDKSLTFFSLGLGTLSKLRPRFCKSMLTEIIDHFDNGVFKPLRMRVYSASDIRSAFQYMAQGNHIGKLAITFKDQEVVIEESPA